MNAQAVALPEEGTSGVAPLSGSPGLLSVSSAAVALGRLYAYGVLQCSIDAAQWRFRWCYIATALRGVELRLRLGGHEFTVLVEDLGPFGSAGDVVHSDVPAALRVAYLTGLAEAAWHKLEALTGRSIQLVGVQPDSTLSPAPDCVGFELGVAPGGVSTRGLLRSTGPGLPDLLCQISRREMAPLPLPMDLWIRWSAVVGGTSLAAGEVSPLEEQDIVVIDDAAYAADGLTCWLGAGSQRRRMGRVLLRRDGRLQLLEFGTKGEVIMTTSTADTVLPEETGFHEIPVSLRFELVRWEAPLAQIASLRPGAIIELGQRIDEQSVTVWVEQRCIGRGQLVAVGERLGVRLLSVLAQST